MKKNPYRTLRLALGYTQEQMARDVGVTRQRWQQIEARRSFLGARAFLTIQRLWGKNLEPLGLTLDDFVEPRRVQTRLPE